jgi:hypothetical protein
MLAATMSSVSEFKGHARRSPSSRTASGVFSACVGAVVGGVLAGIPAGLVGGTFFFRYGRRDYGAGIIAGFGWGAVYLIVLVIGSLLVAAVLSRQRRRAGSTAANDTTEESFLHHVAASYGDIQFVVHGFNSGVGFAVTLVVAVAVNGGLESIYRHLWFLLPTSMVLSLVPAAFALLFVAVEYRRARRAGAGQHRQRATDGQHRRL